MNPAEGWEFSHWEGSFQGRNKTVDATINRNTSVIAVFVKAEEPEPDPGTDPEPEQDPEPDPKLETVVLSFDTSNFRGGPININGETTDPTKPIPIEKGVEVQLEALPGTPQPAFLVRLFRGWRGDLESDENPLTLTMDSDLTIYPLFEDFLEIKPKVVGEGEIILHTEPDVGDNLFSLEKAEAITAEAVPAEGWEFVRWGGSFGNGQETENPATRQLVIAATGVLEAIFEKKTEYVSVKIDYDNARNVSRILINGKNYNPMEEFQFEKGTPIEVLAGTGPQEMTRFLFEGWQGSHTSEENPHTFIPESDMLIYPVFGEYVELHTSVRSYRNHSLQIFKRFSKSNLGIVLLHT